MKKLMLGLLICTSPWVQAQSLDENTKPAQNEFDFSLSQINFGLHASFYKAGNEIESSDTEANTTSMQLGQGIEFGIPYSQYLEYRLGIRNIPFEASVDSLQEEDKLMISLEMINSFEVLPIYFVSGVNYIDNGDIPLSVNIGAGFRYHISESFFAYLESKLYLNAGGTSDFAVNLGVVYQFSSNEVTASKSIDRTYEVGQEPTAIIVERNEVIDVQTGEVDLPEKMGSQELLPEEEKYGILASVGTVFVGIFDIIVDVFSSENKDSADDVSSQIAAEIEEIAQEEYDNENEINSVVLRPFDDCISDHELISGDTFLLYFSEGEVLPSVDNNLRLDCLAIVMKKRLDTLIYIDGYLSADDEPMQRVHLSYTRASNVKAYLMAVHGIAPTRIRVTRHDEIDDFDHRFESENQGDRRVGYRLEVVK
jgi:hypothetical protein